MFNHTEGLGVPPPRDSNQETAPNNTGVQCRSNLQLNLLGLLET